MSVVRCDLDPWTCALWVRTAMNPDVSTRPLPRLFARTARSFTCSVLLASLACSAALIGLLAGWLTRSWEWGFCPWYEVVNASMSYSSNPLCRETVTEETMEQGDYKALWARITKNTGWSTRSLAYPFARSHCSLTCLLRHARFICGLAHFVHSRARGKVNDYLTIFSVFFSAFFFVFFCVFFCSGPKW